MSQLQKIIFIVGPTAIGKSEVAVKLAQQINGEIVSCDSMQVYQDIDIATNKPSLEILKRIPHHLLSIVPVEESFNVAQFNELACKIVEQIHKRGHVPIIVGGSGLYMQILLDGIFKGQKEDVNLREDLKQQAEEKGIDSLYKELEKLDPKAAVKIHPHDLRRIIRALEICLRENEPLSQLQKKREGLWGKYAIKIFALNQERALLYARINQRVEAMVDRGLLQEIQKILERNLSRTAQAIIGIKELSGYLKGEHDLAHAKEMMKMNTRRLAKRQLTWFRREKRIEWIDIKPEDSTETIVGRMLGRI